jgi:prepilin-type N-terminal cleavage/methylation domain-containing protein/prepilin-type processing-associated H-X9-DG protein
MRKRFTLIELLVVIAIIAILASMLLPSLNKARMKGKGIKCKGIMKQFGYAAQMYQNDYQVCVPVDFTNQWHTNIAFRSYLGINKTVSPGSYTAERICPNALTALTNNNLMAYSYGMNNYHNATMSPSFSLAPSRIKRSSLKIQWIDATEWYLGYSEANTSYTNYLIGRDFNGKNVSSPVGVAYRHLQRTNITFYDGHVDDLPYVSVQRIGTETSNQSRWDVMSTKGP